MHPSDEPVRPDPEQPWPRPEPWWRFQRGSSRPWSRTLAATAGSALVIAALGVGLGLLWARLAPGVPVVDVGDSGVVVNDPSPEQYIAADGWFTLLGFAFGVLAAVGAWLLLRRDRGPFLLVGVVGGALVAGHWVAPAIGEMAGRGAYDTWRASAAQGATYLAPPEVHSVGPTLVPAFVAAIVLTLLAGWANDPDLDQPGAQPGYGPNHPESYANPAVVPADLADQAGYPAGAPATGAPAGDAPGGGAPAGDAPVGGAPAAGGLGADPAYREPHQPS